MPLKVELHAHTSDDPRDLVPHSARALIDRAALLGYDAIAITLHQRQLDVTALDSYARERGLTLIPGVERDIEARHVLLLNFSTRSETVSTFADLATLREAEPAGLVVAPHPFFPLKSCVGDRLDAHAHLIDAVEVNGMYVRGRDYNRKALAWAVAHGKPLVGCGDVHRLAQLGTTYSLVDAAPVPQAICEAIRRGRVEVRSEPMSWPRAAIVLTRILTTAGWRALTARVPGGTINTADPKRSAPHDHRQ